MNNKLVHRILLPLAALASIATFNWSYSAQSIDGKPKSALTAAPTLSAKPTPTYPISKLPPAKTAVVAPPLLPVTAITEKPIANRAITIAGVSWHCAANQCSTPAFAGFMAPDSCRALAKHIGRIRSFGSAAKQLNAAELAQCNQATVTLATGTKPAAARATSSGGAISVEANYIAKTKRGVAIPGASSTGAPIAIETNYIARVKAGNNPPSHAATSGTGATPIGIQINYIARPKGR